MYEEGGGGTLPRQQRGILQRAVLNTMPPLEHHHHYMNAAAAAEYVVHAGGLGASGVLDAPSLPSVKTRTVHLLTSVFINNFLGFCRAT